MNHRSLEEEIHLNGDKGIMSRAGVNATAEVVLDYTGRYAHPFPKKRVACEVYVQGESIMVTSCCVRCNQVIKIDSANKKVHWDRDRGLFIEAFTCPWELEGDRRIEFGLGMCSARVEYAGKTIRDS